MSVACRSVGLLIAFPLVCPAGLVADERAIWQIGEFDDTYAELGKTRDYRQYTKFYPKGVVFVVGKSDARTDWPFIHPGPRDRFAGRRPHAYVIEFRLTDPPTGRLVLRLDFVDVHHRYPPRLTIRVNEAECVLTLLPGVGDVSLTDPSKGRQQVVDVGVDAGLLRKGVNRITIANDRGSHVLYDAVALLAGREGVSDPSRLTASPTLLFVETAEGVARLARVRVEGPAAQQQGRLRIAVADKAVKHDVAAVPLGDHVLDAPFPTVDRPAEATVNLTLGAQTLKTTMPVRPAKRWQVCLAPMVHTDIGYTDHQERIKEIHNANTDRAIALCRKYPHYRFRLECAWSAAAYQRGRGQTAMKTLMGLARQRRIGVEANYVNMLTGLCSAEELVRLLYPSAAMARRYGIPFETATQDDTPSYVWSFPTILRRAGVRYLSVGVNNNQTRAPILRGGLDRRSPFWWTGPDGSKVLTWYARGYVEADEVGLSEGLAAAETKLMDWLGGWDRRDDYPYDAVLVHGAYGDNREIGSVLPETVAAWNAKYAYPKLILTSGGEFFRYIESHFADKIPTVSGCGGVYWEDGAASSARETAINRRSHHRVVAAETVAAALSLIDNDWAYPHERLARTWENILLYDEHTWGARRWGRDPRHKSVVEQWATKSGYAIEAERESKALLNEGLAALAGRVAGEGKGVLVFNPLSWQRSDVVRAWLPRGTALVDSDGQRAPMQTLSVEDGRQQVCFVAADVPALGYRRYGVIEVGRQAQPVAPQRDASSADEPPRLLENRFYRVRLDGRSGAIGSIIDKQTGLELVDVASEYKLGEVIYAAGGAGTEAIEWNKGLPPAKFTFSRPARASWRTLHRGDVLTTARSATQTTMLPEIALEVTLYNHVKRLDLTVHLNKTLTYEMEGVYVAFPFSAAKPEIRTEIGGGWVRPDKDMLPGACLDWFCVQNGMTITTPRMGISFAPVDTPLVSLCEINTGKWLRELPLTNGTVFGYVMNNYWLTNYRPGQGGRHALRYSITSDRTMSTTTATRHGWGAGQPLVAMMADASARGSLPTTGSFGRINSPDVVLTAFKRAEDGEGIVLRFLEVAGRKTAFRFDGGGLLPAPKAAWRCDAVERRLEPLTRVSGGGLNLTIDPFGLETVCLQH